MWIFHHYSCSHIVFNLFSSGSLLQSEFKQCNFCIRWSSFQIQWPLTTSEEKRTSVQSIPIPEMNGQKVLVTGAGAGIGRGLTKSLLEMGAEVGILNHVARISCDCIFEIFWFNYLPSRFGPYQGPRQTLNLWRWICLYMYSGKGMAKKFSYFPMGQFWGSMTIDSPQCYGVPLETGLLGLHAHRYWASIFNLTLYPVKQISSMHLCWRLSYICMLTIYVPASMDWMWPQNGDVSGGVCLSLAAHRCRRPHWLGSDQVWQFYTTPPVGIFLGFCWDDHQGSVRYPTSKSRPAHLDLDRKFNFKAGLFSSTFWFERSFCCPWALLVFCPFRR